MDIDSNIAHIVEVLRLHGVDAGDQNPCIAVVLGDGVHLAFDLDRRLVSISDVPHEVHLTYPLTGHPQGMPDHERWLREVGSARETWRRVRDVLPGRLRG